MIISMLAGGLGNMMFQIAAGASLANDLGVEFAYTMDGYEACTDHNVGDYPNTIFKGLKQVSLKDYPEIANRVYREPLFAYDPLPRVDNIVLKGYFQSEKHIKNTKKFENDFNDRMVYMLRSHYFRKQLLLAKQQCFVHVRRGDYVGLSEAHPPCSVAYYTEALNHLKPKTVVVLSDDILWCKENLLFPDFVKGKVFITSDDPLMDLYIMSQSEQAIIANSSFSWWGAWLGRKKQVVAPSRWFGPLGPSDWKDVYCEGWTTL